MDLDLLTELESQHRTAEELLDEIEETTDVSEQEKLVAQLRTLMHDHMEIEEQQVYPALAELDEEMATEGGVEHDLARTGLDQLATLVGQPGFGAALDMVRAGIAHHVEDEEDDAFPMLREALGADGGTDADPTRDELYEAAREADVPGRSTMTKAELADALDRQ